MPQTPQAITTVYTGHPFGVWAGPNGDGRAILLGEWVDKAINSHEIQLKGDGHAVLRPVFSASPACPPVPRTTGVFELCRPATRLGERSVGQLLILCRCFWVENSGLKVEGST